MDPALYANTRAAFLSEPPGSCPSIYDRVSHGLLYHLRYVIFEPILIDVLTISLECICNGFAELS